MWRVDGILQRFLWIMIVSLPNRRGRMFKKKKNKIPGNQECKREIEAHK